MTTDTSGSLHEIADVTAELADLRGMADEVLRHVWSVERTLELLDGPVPAFDEGLWRTIVDLGWPDVLVDTASGGGGGSLRQLTVLAEAAGAAAAPVPLAATAAACWCEQRCAEGVAVLLVEPATFADETVSGTWTAVPFGASASRLLVLGESKHRTVLCAVHTNSDGVQREAVRPLDHSPAATITLTDAPVEVLAADGEARRLHRDALLRTRLATTAELVGIASSANEAATSYAKVRVAFDHPIGSFQAIKHRLVDQRSAVEVGRALVNRAADACEHDDPDAAALVSLSAFWGMDALRSVAEGAMQVFGGIAYTWEHEAHVHLRRAATTAAQLGSRDEHRRAVTDWLAATHPAQR